MIHSHCTRCRRPVLSKNVVTVDGKGYGKACASLVGDLLVQPVERKATRARRARRDERQLVLEVTP